MDKDGIFIFFFFKFRDFFIEDSCMYCICNIKGGYFVMVGCFFVDIYN